MFYTGISDEAGASIETQIKAHQQLGWEHIELRTIDGINLVNLPEEKFQQVVEQLEGAGMRVSCFASEIANWARKISGDFARDVSDLKQAIPRMKRLGTRLIRIMSYPNDNWPEKDWKKEVFRRIKELATIAEEGDVILVHENCYGWGGLSPENSLALLEAVDSPAFKLLFDTGNPPSEGQDGWDFYTKVKEHIVYVHIKDAKQTRQGEKIQFTFAGAGDGYVKEIVRDLLASGYDGGFSIEPHIASVIHLDQQADSDETAFNSYLEYGRRFMKLVEIINRSEVI
ncbi:MAG: sugar phosphate isomerase/epimerase [candidate division KSB1 bacterium]|nr:sugar phosphate isomerase/epimerase [candidate division KSB1 bacterium]